MHPVNRHPVAVYKTVSDGPKNLSGSESGSAEHPPNPCVPARVRRVMGNIWQQLVVTEAERNALESSQASHALLHTDNHTTGATGTAGSVQGGRALLKTARGYQQIDTESCDEWTSYRAAYDTRKQRKHICLQK